MQAKEARREDELTRQGRESYPAAPPVRTAPWKWYIPAYFWAGGLAAGSWLAAAAEDLAGGGERSVVRIGRYTALGGLLGGTALLVADLGRPERFLNMLRVIRPTSAMSIGSWAVTGFGLTVGAAAVLQAAEDGWLGNRPWLAERSRDGLGHAVHLVGIPAALLVGSYTGALLSSTSTPTWARRSKVLPPRFLASATSNGLAAVSILGQANGGASDAAERRLAGAQTVALGSEIALLVAERVTARLPSERAEPWTVKLVRMLTIGAGVALPLALAASRSMRQPSRRTRPAKTGLLGALLTLAGGMTLRFLTVYEGRCSAETPGDTFSVADGGADGRRIRRPDRARARSAGAGAHARSTPVSEVVGRITIVQEDRIRLVDDGGRGYLLVARKRSASLDQLERWRDERVRLRVTYTGMPDAGAIALEFVRAAS